MDSASLTTVFKVVYLGQSQLDRRYTQPMLPWVIANIRSESQRRSIILQITSFSVKAWALPAGDLNLEQEDREMLFEHRLENISRFSRSSLHHCCFAYLHRLSNDARLTCHVFQSFEEHQVLELFNSLRNLTKTALDPAISGCTSMENVLGYSHFFEVLYTGKVKLPQKKAPPTFIDDTVERFRQHDAKKQKQLEADWVLQRQRHASASSISGKPSGGFEANGIHDNQLANQCAKLQQNGARNNAASNNGLIYQNDKSPCKLSLTGSVDTLAEVKVKAERNRTMLMQIGKTEISLISPDRKSSILEKKFKDISFCSQGIREPQYFGFICREEHSENYVCYVFRCQNDSVVDEIMGALKQAFSSAYQQATKYHICDVCPMQQFHKLCIEVEGMSADRAHLAMMKWLESLSDNEQTDVMNTLAESQLAGYQEKNEKLMGLLYKKAQERQKLHVHTSDLHINMHKSEFTLSDGKKVVTNTIDQLRNKAKKSLTMSFDQFLRKKISKEESRDAFRKRSATFDSSDREITPELSPCGTPTQKKEFSKELSDFAVSPISPQRLQVPESRPRSNTYAAGMSSSARHKKPEQLKEVDESRTSPTPMINTFMKFNTPKKSDATTPPVTPTDGLSYRREIFNKVVTPVHGPMGEDQIDHPLKMFSTTNKQNGIKTSAQYRALWKKAITEQILLNRMAKENEKIKMHQNALKNLMKLDYEDLNLCLKESTEIWKELLARSNNLSLSVDKQAISNAVKTGVPKQKRGDVWEFLMDHHLLLDHNGMSDDVSYSDLLKKLTSHQHTILIDLGRTFPNHPYFGKPLGSGQLALFNILKAYSLLDPEVGYCQGLSFVAGILLLHVGDEQKAFDMLRYVMFGLGCRRQYKPDMTALQIQMYQLSRLLHDKCRQLYNHFEEHEIVPSLYAAPWFLTMFASQYPLGFVSRVFDLIFLQGVGVIFKIALVLLCEHKDLILECDSFETVVDLIKTKLPSISFPELEKVVNKAFDLDISKQLHAYEVEYHVLQEEINCTPARADGLQIAQLEQANKNLKRQNMSLLENLQMLHGTVHRMEDTISSNHGVISTMRSRIKQLEQERVVYLSYITQIKALLPDGVAPEMLELNNSITNSGCSIPKNASDVSLDLEKETGSTVMSGQFHPLRRLSGDSQSSGGLDGSESPLVDN